MAKKKISTTKKSDEDENKSILEHFGIPNEDDDTVAKEEPKKDVDVDALVARLDRLEQDNISLQQSNIALMSAPKQVYQHAPAPAQQETMLADLPDPVSDPDAYTRALETRINERIDGALAANKQATQDAAKSSSRIDALWTEFAEDHPDYAENSKLTEYCATKVAETADAKGLNLDTYMFTNSKQFFKDIIGEMDSMLPKQETTEPKENTKDTENEDDNRTGGIFGGLETGGSTSSGSDVEEGDLISDLTDLQRQSGYF